MLIAIIPIQSFNQATALMQQATAADLFEFRLDYLPSLDLSLIAQLQKIAQKPVMFTLRTPAQGGVFKEDEATRLNYLEQLIHLSPEYLDIEHDVSLAFVQALKQCSPHTKIVRSFHDFKHTPDDLTALLNSMQDSIFFAYKIITTAQSIIDTLRVLQFVARHAAHTHLISHAMGEFGVCSRILGRVLGNYFTYATPDAQQSVAPGLLTLDELNDIYHYAALNHETQIYGLIGDPISRSIGHIYHNEKFIEQQQNAVYVKFHVKPAELADFFEGVKSLPIQGLSVTMPHKQAVLSFCAVLLPEVQAIGAANTLIKTQQGFIAANTDGDAVAQLLLRHGPLLNKRVLLLGAGGASSSIAYSLLQHKVQLSVYNRTRATLDEFSEKFSAQAFALSALKDLSADDYDILINTIPNVFYEDDSGLELIQHLLVKSKIIMDANYQATPTLLIQTAKRANCLCIDGYDMFYAQAKAQREYWFGDV